MPKLIISGFLLTSLFMPVLSEAAADLTVRPFLIDRTAQGRDLVQEDISITNNGQTKLNVYSTVNEITVDTEGEIKQFISPVMTDRTNTITSWVEITRGRIELMPGESTAVPLKLRVHPQAKPGEYHVFIGFGAASKRHVVEEAAMRGELDGVIVKLSIEDKTTEHLRVSAFKIDRLVTDDEGRKVEIEIENLGDVSEVPTGEIIFFDSKGQEISMISLNNESLAVEPGETVSVVSKLPFDNELGRFKANLSLQYGTKQKASLFDSTQFFLVPLHILILMLLVAILLALLLFFLLRRSFAYHDDEEDGVELPLFVRDGHSTTEAKQHDIDLSNKD